MEKTKNLVYMKKIMKNLMTGFREIVKKINFWVKMANFGPFLGKHVDKYIFFSKNRQCHFRTLMKLQFCARN